MAITDQIKTTAAHKADGTWRKERHADRVETKPATPKSPKRFKKDARDLWNQIIDGLPAGLVGEIDTAALTAMCDHYALYRAAQKEWQADPLDKEARIAACAAWDRYWRISLHFGTTPIARATMKAPKDPDDDRPFDELLSRLGGSTN